MLKYINREDLGLWALFVWAPPGDLVAYCMNHSKLKWVDHWSDLTDCYYTREVVLN